MRAVAAERVRLALRGRRVVRELRELRGRLGWTLEEAAERSQISAATISRTENGESLRVGNVAALLAAYGVTGDDLRRLMTLTREARRQGWWTGVDEAVMSPPYKDLAELEQEAAWKCSFEPLMVPGLLQTEDYARLALEASHPYLTEEQLVEKLAVRMKRQERLGRFEFAVILLEEVLRRPAGGPEVMRAQLARMLEASSSNYVELRVVALASGIHPGIMGGFSFLGGFDPVDAVVAYIETASGEACFEDQATVGLFQRRYQLLQAVALGIAESRDLIEQLRQRLP